MVPCCGAPLSVTTTRIGFGSAVPTCAVWPSPLALAVWAITGEGAFVPPPLLHPTAASDAIATDNPTNTCTDFTPMAPDLSSGVSVTATVYDV